MNKNIIILILLIITLILFYFYKKSKSSLDNINSTCPIIKNSSITKISNIIGDIAVKPVGCYINIIDMFFTSCINPYSRDNVPDTGFSIDRYPSDVTDIIKKVNNNGYDLYGNSILNKYRNSNYTQLNILELASLGYLAGYKYMSITNENELNQIFFSYSPPLNSSTGNPAKPDLPFTLMPKINGYTNEFENASGKELSCGTVCLKNGKPQTDGNNVYTCGSMLSPTIKTTPRYSVYEIYEKN